MVAKTNKKIMKSRIIYINTLRLLLLALTVLLVSCLVAQPTKKATKIVVDINGKGDFISIQEAINSLPDSSATARIIFIKKLKTIFIKIYE